MHALTRSGNDNSWLKRMLHISFLLNSDQQTREIKIEDTKKTIVPQKENIDIRFAQDLSLKLGHGDPSPPSLQISCCLAQH